MIGGAKMTTNDIKPFFDKVQLRMDTNIKIALPSSKGYDIYEMYDPGLEMDPKINLIGIFENRSFTYFNNDAYYHSRKNMSGVLIRSANRQLLLVNYTFETQEDYTNELRYKETDTFQKYDFQLFMKLKEIHEFHYNTTLRSWWFGNSTIGLEGGISQLLYENTADISSSGGILRPGRMHYYDHYVPSYKFRTCFFFKNPGVVEERTDVLKPFALNTWYVTISSIIIMGVAIKAAYWAEHKYLNSPSRYSLFTAFVLTIAIFAQQGSAIIPRHTGGRIIFLTLLILSILVYNYYTSSLVSSLLSTKPPAIHTIKQLYESDLKVGIEYQPYTLTYIYQEKNNYYIQKLNSNKIYDPEPNFFLLKRVSPKTFEQDYICDLVQIDFLTPGFVSFMAPKKSQYKELFQISLLKMMQNGIFNREENIWVEKQPKCLSDLRVVSVDGNALFVVYMILVIGIVLATIILLIEIVWYKADIKKTFEYTN
ncbi:hypothetical protein NQ318_019366 [Aromia moschata]|uniref:Ionotropic glutamate receptor C-terminal domain-containing protein n=1 Tax=Aromia moschata TaxID=1265417 RepID=A0AAV8XXS3_9CUCU|nr:hypothetical protein NQ318_019366 [Aromia moschata]